MRRLLVSALVLAGLTAGPCIPVARAAVTVGVIGSSFGNDVTLTLSGTLASASSTVVVYVGLGTTAATIDITGWDGGAEVVLGASPYDHSSTNARMYVFCLPGHASDTTFVVNTSGGGNATAIAAEFIGSEVCAGGAILEDIEQTESATATSHSLATDVTVATANSEVFGYAYSMSGAADLTATGDDGTVPAGDTEISNTLGQYKAAATAGDYDTTYTSTSDSFWLFGIVVKAAAAAGVTPRGTLLGVLP
jgi:hypothetical protein